MQQNSGIEISDQSRWWKNSFLGLPKNSSIAESLGMHPFFDIDLVRSFLSQMAIHPGRR